MTTQSIIIGLLISSLGGAIALWILIDIVAWGYLSNRGVPKKPKGVLTVPLGIVERILYTGSIITQKPEFIGVWLALKVASHWKLWDGKNVRGTYNVFLIGSGLSVIISYLGAWIILGKLPIFYGN